MAKVATPYSLCDAALIDDCPGLFMHCGYIGMLSTRLGEATGGNDRNYTV